MKKYKPTTPSRRGKIGILYKDVLSSTKSKPLKKLTKGFSGSKGRNSDGRITTRHKGGGNKRLYRQVDFKYDKHDIFAKVETIEYDPYRSGFIALVVFKDGERRYVLAPQNLKPGDEFIISENADMKLGNRLPLSKITPGIQIFNIEVQPRGGAKLVRSAGSSAELLAHDAGYAHFKMPSKEIRKVSEKCWATIGSVSNEEHNQEVSGKAGRSRWLGIRPTVRGSAMNPVDHPYGGGEGCSPRGTKRPKTKWGKITGGRKTRKKKKYSNHLIITRRKKRK